MTNVVRANRTIEDRARFGVGSETQDDDSAPSTDETQLTVEGVVGAAVTGLATQTELDTHATTDLAASNHGLPKVTVADGVNETTPTDIPVSGMAVGDIVTAVLVLTTKASIATLAAHAGTLTAASGGITPGTPADNTGNQYIIHWIDVT